jgi:peroxiredoxin
LGRLYPEFKSAGTEVLVILGDTLEQARSYGEALHLPFPVLSDPEREVYHRFGLEVRFFLQRTASVVVDAVGVIRYIRRTTNPMVWLQESTELLEAAKGIKSQD